MNHPDANAPGPVPSGVIRTPLTALLSVEAKAGGKAAQEIAQLLVDAGARPDLADSTGCTPLHCPCSAALLGVLLGAKPAQTSTLLTMKTGLRCFVTHLKVWLNNAKPLSARRPMSTRKTNMTRLL